MWRLAERDEYHGQFDAIVIAHNGNYIPYLDEHVLCMGTFVQSVWWLLAVSPTYFFLDEEFDYFLEELDFHGTHPFTCSLSSSRKLRSTRGLERMLQEYANVCAISLGLSKHNSISKWSFIYFLNDKCPICFFCIPDCSKTYMFFVSLPCSNNQHYLWLSGKRSWSLSLSLCVSSLSLIIFLKYLQCPSATGKCANRLLSSSGLPLLTKQMKVSAELFRTCVVKLSHW